MRITKLIIASHMGDNGAPGSGFVEFSDGRDYSFSWDPIDQAYTLAGFVRMAGTLVRRGVRAPKRVALLAERLNA